MVSDAELWWTGGFLDGDGSVTYCRTLRVSVGQAEKGLHSLERLKELFGGAIYLRGKQKPRHQQVYQWFLCSSNAKAFCKLIAPYTVLKRKQFELAASLKDNRHKCRQISAETRVHKERLREMKKEPHDTINTVLPVEYVAGMVDSDGHIGFYGRPSVSVSQKWPAITDYLQKTYGGRVTTATRRNSQNWVLSGDEFMRLLEPVLFTKRKQAQLALDPSPENQEALRAMHGNQGVKRKHANV